VSDFSQQGLITTLQRLNENNAAALERDLENLARESPIALVLPCHAGELGEPALDHVIEEIAGAKFLREIVVSMNGLEQRSAKQAQKKFARLPQPHRILWNDSPRVTRARNTIAQNVIAGKGLNVWSAIGLLARESRCNIIALLDCDVLTFRREMLVRLCYACTALDYAFAKMYYSRVTDRIYGRVSRLFVAPLLQALMRVSGHQPLLDFLLSFRYPLAGEMAITRELAASLPFDGGWGLEIAMLCEIFRRAEPRKICQVDGGSDYNHRHQPLGSESGGLFKMSKEIARALFLQLLEEGLPICSTFTDAVLESYRSESREALVRFKNLARINGLHFDEADEMRCVQSFARALAEASAETNTGAGAILPAWDRIEKTRVDFFERINRITASQTNSSE